MGTYAYSSLPEDLEKFITEHRDGRFSWDQFPGVAFYIYDVELKPDEDTEWSGYAIPTGNVIVVMVGDDREWTVDPKDLVPISDEDYCSGCGQIGCKADV